MLPSTHPQPEAVDDALAHLHLAAKLGEEFVIGAEWLVVHVGADEAIRRMREAPTSDDETLELFRAAFRHVGRCAFAWN